MKKQISLLLCSFFAAFTIFFLACGEGPYCTNKDCGTHGRCMDDACFCDSGYETDLNGRCEVVSREKFYGRYDLEETCTYDDGSKGTTTYEVIISDTLSTGITTSDLGLIGIKNLGGYQCLDSLTKKQLPYYVEARVVSPNSTFSIWNTQACGFEFLGEGILDGATHTILLDYTASYKDDLGKPRKDVCKAVLTRK